MSKASVELAGLEPNQLAAHVSSLYEQWHTSRVEHRKRLAEIKSYIYATSTKETTNVSNPWSHTTHIPKLTQIKDNLGAQYSSALFGRDEFFSFEPGDAEAAVAGKKKAINAYLLTKHKYSKFRSVMKQLLDDWVETGNCFVQLQYVREMGKDRQGNAVVVYEGPKPFRISPYDIEFDPTAIDFASTPKVVRQVITRGEFFRNVEEMPELMYDPAEVDRMKMFHSTVSTMKADDIEKINQSTLDGFGSYGQYITSGKVELLHFYGDIYDPVEMKLHKDAMITVVDRRFLLRNVCASDFGNIGQIYHSGWRKRPDNLWSMGPLENLVGMQYLIDHLENARADAFDQMLSPDEVYIGQVDTVQDGAVRKHYIDDGEGSVTQLRPDATVLQADFQIQVKEAQMEAYAGAPREAMGIRSPGEKTAFEIESLQNAAGRLFQVKIEDFEVLVEDLLNGEIELGQRNLSVSDLVEVMDDDFGVVDFMKITREDLLARGKLRARGASHFARRSQLVRELSQFGQTLQADPALAVHFPALERAKMWNELMGFERFSVMQPFGQIAEEVDKQKMMQSAQALVEQDQAAEGAVAAAEQEV